MLMKLAWRLGRREEALANAESVVNAAARLVEKSIFEGGERGLLRLDLSLRWRARVDCT